MSFPTFNEFVHSLELSGQAEKTLSEGRERWYPIFANAAPVAMLEAPKEVFAAGYFQGIMQAAYAAYKMQAGGK